MPIRELGHFTVNRFFGTGKTPLGWLHARGWAGSRSRLTRSARAHPREGTCERARVVFQLSRDREPAERTWYQPSLARYSRVTEAFATWNIQVPCPFENTASRLSSAERRARRHVRATTHARDGTGDDTRARSFALPSSPLIRPP